MTASDPRPDNPLEVALDALLYAPVGLALTAAEELPKLAAIGRSRIERQVTAARVVGRFAVSAGRREAQRRLDEIIVGLTGHGVAAGTSGASGVTTAEAGAATSGPSAPAAPAPPSRTAPASSSGSAADVPAVAAAPSGPPAPEASALAIPGYDSLSASQVVQRLAGLEEAELEAVRLYEEAHRGRRTVLSRIAQLQGR